MLVDQEIPLLTNQQAQLSFLAQFTRDAKLMQSPCKVKLFSSRLVGLNAGQTVSTREKI